MAITPDPVDSIAQLLGAAVEQNLEGIEIATPAGVILYANAAHESVVNAPIFESLGRAVYELGRAPLPHELSLGLEPDPVAKMQEVLLKRAVWRGRVATADADRRYHDVLMFPVETAAEYHVVVVRRDISDEISARLALANSERMVALGQVARVLGHDMNNPLSIVQHNLAAVRAAVGPEQAQLIAEAEEALGRVADRLRDLSAFGRRAKATDAFSIARAVDVARRTLDNTAAMWVRCDVDAHLQVRGDRAALIRALSHLIGNACDAVRGTATPAVIITAELQGANVEICVEDNGPGFDVQRALEPFFTTKDGPHHAGLGLTFASESARGMGGELTLESLPGLTRARLVLPAEPAAEPGIEPSSGRVLIVEDEAPLRRAYGRWLRDQFEVTSVGSVEEALGLTAEQSFDVVMCDVMMPGASGVDLMIGLPKPLRSRLIFVTGGITNPSLGVAVERSGQPVLVKPVSREDLLYAVTKLMGSTRAA